MRVRIQRNLAPHRSLRALACMTAVAGMLASVVPSARAAHSIPAPAPGGRGAAITIIDASPRIDAGDGRAGNGSRRVTFTPNHDGVNERVVLRVCAPSAARLQLRGWAQRRYWYNDVLTTATGPLATQPARLPAGCRAGDRVFELEWNGKRRQGGSVSGDSLVLRPCLAAGAQALPPDAAVCTPSTVMVRATNIYARLRTAGSVVPGGTLAFDYFADQSRPLAAVLLPDGAESLAKRFDQPVLLAGVSGRGPARASVEVPAGLAPGRYSLGIFATGSGALQLDMPVIVRAVGWSHDQAPPPRTALVVWPTYSWSAYERFDDDRDGAPDSWYYNNGEHLSVPLLPWFEGRKLGAQADLDATRGLTTWLQSVPTRSFTSITDAELGDMPSGALRGYEAIWFAGHDEYYEQRTFDKLLWYRDGGGDIAFFSANNTARRVNVDPAGSQISNLDYRSMTFNEYRLAGIGIRACGVDFSQGYTMSALIDATNAGLGWLFTGTDIAMASPLNRLGVEIDGIDAEHSPSGMGIAAQSPEVPSGNGSLGGCRRATTAASMTATRFSTISGWVFAAGNLDFLRGLDPAFASPGELARTGGILTNLWSRMVLEEGDDTGGPIATFPATATGGGAQANARTRVLVAAPRLARSASRRVRGVRPLLPVSSLDVISTLRLARAIEAQARRAARAHRRPAAMLTPRAREALAELQALERDAPYIWEETDEEPLEREAGIEPDPLLVLWGELRRMARTDADRGGFPGRRQLPK